MSGRSEVRELAGKVGFTEGPAWTGERLVVTSISRGHLYEIPLGGSPPINVADFGGGPNGAAVAADGSVWVAQNGGHVITMLPEPVVPPGIQRSSPGGTVDYVVSGDPVQAPNDLAFAPDGALWFTDPHPRLDREDPKPGRVWRRDAVTGELECVLEGRPHPNGLAFSADGTVLYLVETVPRHVLRIPLIDGIRLGEPEVLVTLEGEPDGMALDVEGRLYIACHQTDDAVMVCEPDGEIRERLPLDGMFPTNVCFAGEDLQTLVITAPKGGRVVAIEREVPGLSLIG